MVAEVSAVITKIKQTVYLHIEFAITKQTKKTCSRKQVRMKH